MQLCVKVSGEGVYLLDSSDQVLDKQSSEVVERLQLSAL